jgi:4a-hydroxytetrahydrobiopterin dehydratase
MEEVLSRPAASAAVAELGWRFILGTLRTTVPVASLGSAAEVAARAVALCGDDADGHLRAELRPDRVVLTLQSAVHAATTSVDADLARRITAAGLPTSPESCQLLEIAIDALDIPAIRPFWKAVLGYADEASADQASADQANADQASADQANADEASADQANADQAGTHEAGADRSEDPIVDPLRLGPAIWFQQMSAPRPQRNRIHFDISVPHDSAPARIEAALAAGGHLVSDDRAPAFWVLADPEGNEACITTWQGRD